MERKRQVGNPLDKTREAAIKALVTPKTPDVLLRKLIEQGHDEDDSRSAVINLMDSGEVDWLISRELRLRDPHPHQLPLFELPRRS